MKAQRNRMTNFRYANSRYMHIATHSCVMTAFFDRPTKRFTFRCCLIHLKKQLDLPPRFVYIRNRLGHPRCVVGHEHIAVLRHRILVGHSPQRRGIRLPAASAGQLYRLIAEDAGPGSDVMLARDPISHAPLQARHEGHAPRLQLMEPLEVQDTRGPPRPRCRLETSRCGRP